MGTVREEIAKNIAYYRKQKKLTQRALAEAVGVKHNSVSTWESGANAPDIETIFKLASVFCVAVSDIYGQDTPNNDALTPPEQRIGRAYGKATPPVKRTVEVALEPFMDDDLPPTKKAPSKMEDAEIAAEIHVDTKKIVYIGSIVDDEEEDTTTVSTYYESSAAGYGNYLGEDLTPEEYDYPSSVVPDGTDYAVRISGDSMEPEIESGSVAFVNAGANPDDGEIGIFVLNGNSYCKRLYWKKRPWDLRLISENDEYDDIIVSKHDNLSSRGRVIGWYKPEK